MTTRQLLVYLLKLLICGVVYSLGVILGGAIAGLLKLPAPVPPPGVDVSSTGLYLMLTSPLLAFALALIARGLGGATLTRTVVLAFFTWIAYTVNTQLEASIFSTYARGFWFAVVSYLFPSLFVAAAVAYLFPPAQPGAAFIERTRSFFASRSPLAWLWRLPLAALAFAPVYFLFGMMVVPFTGEYYRQNMFGLTAPTIDQILPVLLLRSLLFLLATLPIFILWQQSRGSLFWRLGFGLYMLVGLIYMLISTWLPPYVRFPHSLEILADEFVYAGLLVLLLGVPTRAAESPRAAPLAARTTSP